MTDTQLPPLPSAPISGTGSGWTLKDWFSERILFGLLIIVGYIGLLLEYTHNGSKLDSSIQNVLSTGLGTLGAALGVVIAAVYKSDKTDRQNADTLAKMAQTPTTTTVSMPPVTS